VGRVGVRGRGALRDCGVAWAVQAIEVGIRELQRTTAAVMAQVEDEDTSVIVTRQRRPVAVLLPIARAHAWVLQYRPLDDDLAGDETFWPLENGVRLSPVAEERLAALPPYARRRLFVRLRKLRGFSASGRIALKAGPVWALADLNQDDEPTLLDVARRAELERWFRGPAVSALDQPM